MIKKVLVCSVLFLLVFQSSAFAVIETQGDVVFRDALYGAAIGGLVGGAVYLTDQNDFAKKVGIGVIIGAVGGIIFGVVETRSVAEIDNNGVKFAVPTPVIEQRGDETIYSTSLLNIELD